VYIEILLTVVPTGTGVAVLPTVRGMQAVLKRLASAAKTEIADLLFIIGSGLGYKTEPRIASRDCLYVGLRSSLKLLH
jgi:hypothetical protein